MSSPSPVRMPSTSSSSSSTGRRPCKHDVFLSFRGQDTRTGFTGHLYKDLTSKGINTFRDDENLRVGDPIRPELLKAIEESKFGIVVLSRGYADSTWCLEELAHIVEKELIVIPVFYHVDPSDVRYQRKTFGEAFAKHETSNRFPPEKVETWRAALTTVGHISGSHVQGTRYESKEISKIVRRILKDLQDTFPRDATRGLIGIESRVKELKSLLNMESNDVRFIGICGMSGMGKTTLAEVVYEGIRNQFERYSFIPNIKDISKENFSDLCMLQQKLLVDILNEKHIRVRTVMEGCYMLWERLCGLKIIIVLDDVNHRDQLEYLAGERKWFGNGSRIIITTTNEDLLKLHGVDEKYKCEGLNFVDANRLFNLSAFKKEQPNPGYEKLSSNIVQLAGGLPLALKVFGSLLHDKGEIVWRETLVTLQKFPQKEVLRSLEICYERLDRNEQEIFIYIACFLQGRDQVLVNDILKNIDLHPESVNGVDTLINRSLITINYDDSVWMHDLLQQMGWEVLRKKFPRQPGKRVGLKCRKDIVEICTGEEKGTNAIEIINQEHYRAEVENFIGDRESFSKMKKLKFLRISNVDFSYGLEYLSNDLRILEWYGCSLKSFPPTFGPEKIYELDIRSSRLEKLWEKDINLPNLRSINLCGSEDLTKVPNLTSTPKLLKLNLEGCINLVEFHQSLLAHKTLRYVNLKGCRNLRSLGNNIEMDGLEAFLLSGCSKLEHIPEFGENMKRLEDLYLDGTKIERLPESLGKMRSLRKLNVSKTAIEELPSFLLHLERLRLLHIHGCRLLSLTRTFHSKELSSLSLKELDLSACNLSAIPDDIGLLYSLKELDLSENDFVTLPANISLLTNLKMLCLNSCTRLESLPLISKRNEVTLHGGEIRFSHYISREGLDVSKFRMSSHGDNPSVSCLNCPNLIENQSGSGLADIILKKYLQVRTESRDIPEAIFEIVAAGSEIPPWFKQGGLRTDGKWHVCDSNFNGCIGVALCAVIVVPHSLENMRGGAHIHVAGKYEVVARINVAGKYWRIPVPINFLETELETQIVWYCTVSDDCRARYGCQISFSVEPEGGNLEIKNVRVRFLHRKEILRLRRFSITGIPSIMEMNPPSTSFSSTGRRLCKHHVFLSFNGEDTLVGFTSHLCDALTRQGIDTFMNGESHRGGYLIGPKLLKAIEESRFGIVVLSSGYAASTRCLEELAYIVDRMEKTDLIVIPVFYHVDPSDVRYQRNTSGEAFAKRKKIPPEEVETWRAALRKVGDMSGLHVQGSRYESEEIISEIVRRISTDLQDALPKYVIKGLVGIESRVEELTSLLDMESNDVCFIGICGMSGMGKTILAKVVYEGIRNQFQGCSFIENIKDISKKNDNNLCKLQQKLLVDILKDEHIRVRTVIEGVSILHERLCGLKIIIVLDDVNHRDQLKFLAGEHKWFGHGSRIIMTTTNEDLLTEHGVDGRYKCEGLKLSDATRLFNLKAFADGQPKPGYEKLSNDILELSGGLPLALNTFGSLLLGKGENIWSDTLKKLQQIPKKEVRRRLEICYDSLDKNEKDIFIYIACFLKGRNQVLVNDILENIGLLPKSGIDILINRSLITINYDDSVWMHDLLQQMGWEVLCKEFLRHPGKRIGVKCRKDIVEICTCEEKGTKAIEIINQEQCGTKVDDCIGHPKSFSKMKTLKFLRISNVDFPDGLELLANDL